MQNKFTGCRYSYINTRRIQNKVLKNILELVGPDPELECGKGELENIMRWEDDGGSLIDTRKSTLQMKEMNHNRKQR
jgi:hypothetical protein